MTRSNQIFDTKRIIAVILLLLIYIASNAQVQNEEQKNATNSLFKDTNVGFIIVIGILGIGITGYIIISIVEKYQDRNQKPDNKTTKQGYSRHHHRVIKKSS